jgi:conjugal transfer/type IV secretion protein DotA/TraY
MKKIFITIAFLFLSVLSVNVYAEDSNSGSVQSSEKCAIYDNKIKSNSFEICQKDESFRMLYELFPKFFEESVFNISDFGDIEYLKDNPEISLENQYRKFSNILYAVFGSLNNLTYYIISFFLFYFSFFSILKAADSGDFMADGRQNLTKSIIYAGIVGFLLVPIGGLTLVQMLVLVLSIIAISLANMVYGNYLSVFQYNVDFIDPNNNENPSYILNKIDDSSTALMTKTYLTDLTKMAVCRDVTSQLILEQSIFDLKQDNLYEKTNCSSGYENFTDSKTLKSTNNNSIAPTFFNLKYVDVYNSKSKTLSHARNIVFGIDPQSQRTCAEKNFMSYSCGEIVTKSPKMNDAPLLKIYGVGKFIDKVVGISNGLNLNGGNYSSINDGWLGIKEDIITKLKERSVDGSDLSKEAEKILDNTDTSGMKQIAYIYHQLILNSLTTGLSFKTYFESSDFVSDEAENLRTLNSDNFKAFLNDWEKVQPLSKKIQKNHCILKSEGLASSYETLSKLTSNKATVGGSARCVDFDNAIVYGVDANGSPITDEEESNKQSMELTLQIVEDFDELAAELFKRRKEVETSFLNSLNLESQENALNNLRQKGWLSMPTYLMEASKEIKNNNVYIKSLLSANKFNPLHVELNGISPDILAIKDIRVDRYLPYIGDSNIYKNLVNVKASKNVYFDNESFSNMKIQNNPEGFTDGSFDIKDFMSIIMNPIAPLKTALGIDQINKLASDENRSILEKCKEDKDNCPIPKTDPLVGLSQYGHYLINVSINYFLIIVSLKGISTVGKSVTNINKRNRANNKNPDKNKGGVGSNPILDTVKDKLSKSGTIVAKGLEFFGGMLDIMSEILSALGTFVILLFFVGIFLAYIFPLIPMIYFIVGFITWLLLILQVILIAPIWAAHFIKFEENKDVIMKAAKNYGLQILFKPLFMVLGMIFAWELFKIALFYINITVFSMFSAIASDEGMLSFVYETVFLLLLILMLYIVIKYILDMISTITEMLLKLLGAETTVEQSGSFNEMMKYYLVDKGMSLAGDINKGVLEGTEEAISNPIMKADQSKQERLQMEESLNQIAEQENKKNALSTGKSKEDLENTTNPVESQLEQIKKQEEEKLANQEAEEFLEEELINLKETEEKLLEKINNNQNNLEKDSMEKELEELKEKILEKEEEIDKGSL